jgi:16S rRNA (cytosine1402-N4)-methyltransferase
MSESRGHIPVMLSEVLAALDPKPGETVLDCTAGLGGHAAALSERIGPSGRIVLCDLDPANLARAESRLRDLSSSGKGAREVVAIHANFAESPRRLAELGIAADGVLADLGFASTQVDDPERGFSFMKDGPLDMRMNPAPGSGPSAADLVNSLSVEELTEIIRDYGEDRGAWRIAQQIAAKRLDAPITTTGRLAEIIRAAAGPPTRTKTGQRIDPATRTFQALRIAVNDELGSVRSLVESVARAAATLSLPPDRRGSSWLKVGSRVAIISFHSLEDRIVKQGFTELCQRSLATPCAGSSKRKPDTVEATDDEIHVNPRARSAKLRAIRLTGGVERSQDHP